MKRIHYLVIKSYIGPLILTFFIVIFLLLMQFLWKYIDDMVGKGLEMSIISELLMYTSAGFVPLALPLAILIASLMTFGNLGENNELLALKSAGISLQRIMLPLIALTIIFSVLAFVFANNVLPVIQLHSRSLLTDIRKQKPEISITPGVFYSGIEDYSIKVEKRNSETSLLTGIRIYNHNDKNAKNKVILADSGYMKISDDESKMLITLFNGKSYTEVEEKTKRNESKKYPHQKDFFEEENIVIPLDGFGLDRTDKGLHASHYQMMTIKQLGVAQDSIQKTLTNHNQRVVRMINNDIERSIKYMQNRTPSKPKGDTLDIDPYELISTIEEDKMRSVYEKAISSARQAGNQMRSLDLQVRNARGELRKHQIQWHKKITLAVACFIFFFIGAPLGAIIRKGGLGTPIVVSVVFFLVYYMMTLTGEKLVGEGLWRAFPGMWISSMILFLAGTFLTYKATTDSVIMNTETYVNFVKNIFKKKKTNLNADIAN